MKKYRQDEQPAAGNRSTPVTVRVVESPAEVQKLLAVVPGRSLLERNTRSSASEPEFPIHLIVAFDGDSTVGCAAFKATSGAIRVAHVWVDPHVSCGLAPVAEAILRALESAVTVAGCSRLVVPMGHSTSLRKVLEGCGYVASLTSAELSWYEKSLLVGPGPLELA